MFVVDTNVLVYAADRDSAGHERCRELVESWRSGSGAWYSTWSILYEFVRVTTHRRVMERPWSFAEAWGFVEALAASPGFRVLVATERHADVVRELAREVPDVTGNLVHDFHIAALMREHGLRAIYTRDTDFHKFGFLDPIDPLR